jgi:glycosyltransferase involved in cell wall biosynthesis
MLLVNSANDLDAKELEMTILKNGERAYCYLENEPGYQGVRLSATDLRAHLGLGKEDILMLHDASTMDFFSKIPLRCAVWICLHGDYSYYYNTAVKFGEWADRIIVVNQNLKLKMGMLFPHHLRVSYLPPPPPNWKSPDLRKKKAKTILFVGRKTHEKGAHLLPLIDAYLVERGLYHTWTVVTSGSAVASVEEELNRWQQAAGNQRVKLLSNLESHLLEELYNENEVFVLPSQYEGYPLALIEALSQGCVPFLFEYNKDVYNQVPAEVSGDLIKQDWSDIAEAISMLTAEELKRLQGFCLTHFSLVHSNAIIVDKIRAFSADYKCRRKTRFHVRLARLKRHIFFQKSVDKLIGPS